MKQRLFPAQIITRKGKTPLVCLTAHSAPQASLLDGVADVLLVGDSLGMIVYGLPSTVPVTLEMMINHGRAVASHAHKSCVVVDMPFGSYQQSSQQAMATATRLLKETGCQAVKLEGGAMMAPTIEFLTSRGIPVMAHIGLLPQSFNAQGGYKVQGRTDTVREQLLRDATAAEQAGAFCVVLEGVVEPVARDITNAVAIPTIGIGASVACDGQILVTDDMLGLHNGHVPKFVKKYADTFPMLTQAVAAFADDVRARHFPGEEQCFK